MYFIVLTDSNLTKITSMAQIDNERITQINVYNKLIQATSINSMFYEIFWEVSIFFFVIQNVSGKI